MSLMKKPDDKAPGKLALQGIEKVDRFIAIASGKGGVGKTTVAVNLALALSKRGLSVGLLDADVYGPSIPVMLGLKARPMGEEGMLVPPEQFGIDVMSVGFLTRRSRSSEPGAVRSSAGSSTSRCWSPCSSAWSFARAGTAVCRW